VGSRMRPQFWLYLREANRDKVVDVLERTAFEQVANVRCLTNNATKLALSNRLTISERTRTAGKIGEASAGWRSNANTREPRVSANNQAVWSPET
jgi:hypothetical protein